MEQKNNVVVYREIPYSILNDDLDGIVKSDFFTELNEIAGYYEVYRKGAEFTSEGANGDYVPSQTRYKKARNLINKEARFMFSVPFDITVNFEEKNDEASKTSNDNLNKLIRTIMSDNHFNSEMVKAGRDCFIGKRICITANFNDTSGVTLTFLKATEFYYEYSGNVLTKLIAFYVEQDASNSADRIIRKKTYTLEEEVCYITDQRYDGLGVELETTMEHVATKLSFIPGVIIQNDGLLGDIRGESEIEEMLNYEREYSKLANLDIDAERKSMNATRYTIDASSESTKNLSIAPGSFWDIQSDDNGVEQKSASVGMLEPSMTYSQPLQTTLERIDQNMYSELSVPNIDGERLQGVITSGKTLKALYWPLVVRCNEKALVWIDQLEALVRIIVEGCNAYPASGRKHGRFDEVNVAYKVEVVNNYPLPEDEQEEKTVDMAEVSSQVMSRKAYMMKWRGLTEEEARQELEQIAMERQLLEDMFTDVPVMGEGTLGGGMDEIV